uniref:Uncharacterized protein n=1 Tax=Piliocolobus tephrosceles TaxID=591936 RepID=A0A8C9IXR5_9PRIM
MRGGQRATSRRVPGARGLGAPERPREEATRSPAPLGAARGPCRPERSVRPGPRAGTCLATAAKTRAAAAEPGGRRECGTGARAEAARHGAGAAAAGGLRGALASRRTLPAPAPASASRAHRGHGQGAAQGGPGAAAAAGERALRGLRRPGSRLGLLHSGSLHLPQLLGNPPEHPPGQQGEVRPPGRLGRGPSGVHGLPRERCRESQVRVQSTLLLLPAHALRLPVSTKGPCQGRGQQCWAVPRWPREDPAGWGVGCRPQGPGEASRS